MTGDEFPFDGPRLLSLRTQDWPEADRVLALARDRPDEAMARKCPPSDVGFQANQAEAAYVALWPLLVPWLPEQVDNSVKATLHKPDVDCCREGAETSEAQERLQEPGICDIAEQRKCCRGEGHSGQPLQTNPLRTKVG